MSTQSIAKAGEFIPAAMDDFFKPWKETFGNFGLWNREMTVPAVNILEEKDSYKVSLAAPGLKKSDFDISLDGNMLTIKSEREESKEEKQAKYSRREYSYSSFSRSFNLPEHVNQAQIEASYQDGVLNITLPKKEEARKNPVSKHIAVK